MHSVIKESFLKLVRRVRLGRYWRSIRRRYIHEKIGDYQVRWIIKAKERGISSRDISSVQKVSVRRVNQLYALYRNNNGTIPALKCSGRPRGEITEEERMVVRDALRRFGVGACYLEHLIRNFYGIKIHHMKVYRVMKEEGLLYSRARRHVRRRWIRYEREHSNELWHTDWHEMEHPSYRGKQLLVYEDDASRFIIGWRLFDSESSENAVSVLDETIREYGRPDQVLSDRGPSFYANESEARRKGLTKFELYLMSHHIEQVLCGVRHPETNGKLEKLFDTLETGLERGFFPIERCVEWHNSIKPHGSLDLESCETPVQAYYRKMRGRDTLVDPSIVIQEGGGK